MMKQHEADRHTCTGLLIIYLRFKVRQASVAGENKISTRITSGLISSITALQPSTISGYSSGSQGAIARSTVRKHSSDLDDGGWIIPSGPDARPITTSIHVRPLSG